MFATYNFDYFCREHFHFWRMASKNLKPRTLVRPQHLTSLCSRFMRTKFKPASVFFSNCIKIQNLYVLYTIRYKEVRSLHRDFATERFKKNSNFDFHRTRVNGRFELSILNAWNGRRDRDEKEGNGKR